MNLTITNTDELTVWLLYVCIGGVALATIIFICTLWLLIDCRARLKQLDQPRVERSGDWPPRPRQERRWN